MERDLDARSPLFVLLSAIITGQIQARGRQQEFSILYPGLILNENGVAETHSEPKWSIEKSEVILIPQEFWSDFVILQSSSLRWHGVDCDIDLRAGRIGIGEIGYSEVEILSGRYHRSGRKAKYDWSKFQDFALNILDSEGGLQDEYPQSAFERAMTNWCESVWSITPSEASIRRRVKIAEASYLQTKRKKGS